MLSTNLQLFISFAVCVWKNEILVLRISHTDTQLTSSEQKTSCFYTIILYLQLVYYAIILTDTLSGSYTEQTTNHLTSCLNAGDISFNSHFSPTNIATFALISRNLLTNFVR